MRQKTILISLSLVALFCLMGASCGKSSDPAPAPTSTQAGISSLVGTWQLVGVTGHVAVRTKNDPNGTYSNVDWDFPTQYTLKNAVITFENPDPNGITVYIHSGGFLPYAGTPFGYLPDPMVDNGTTQAERSRIFLMTSSTLPASYNYDATIMPIVQDPNSSTNSNIKLDFQGFDLRVDGSTLALHQDYIRADASHQSILKLDPSDPTNQYGEYLDKGTDVVWTYKKIK